MQGQQPTRSVCLWAQECVPVGSARWLRPKVAWAQELKPAWQGWDATSAKLNFSVVVLNGCESWPGVIPCSRAGECLSWGLEVILGSRLHLIVFLGTGFLLCPFPFPKLVIMNSLALHSLLCFCIKLGVVNGRCVDSTFPFWTVWHSLGRDLELPGTASCPVYSQGDVALDVHSVLFCESAQVALLPPYCPPSQELSSCLPDRLNLAFLYC